MERIYLTRKGYQKLAHELDYLKNVQRKEIANALEHARQLEDLRENSDYSAAEEAFSFEEIEHNLAGPEEANNQDFLITLQLI